MSLCSGLPIYVSAVKFQVYGVECTFPVFPSSSNSVSYFTYVYVTVSDPLYIHTPCISLCSCASVEFFAMWLHVRDFHLWPI